MCFIFIVILLNSDFTEFETHLSYASFIPLLSIRKTFKKFECIKSQTSLEELYQKISN